MRFRLKRENSGFDEYVNIYDEKNKLTYYSVEVDYAKPKRLLYDKTQTRITTIDFSPTDIDDIMNGYPVYMGRDKVAYYDDSLEMNDTKNVEFAHITGPELSFIEISERLTFREYVLTDSQGETVMRIKRAGTDFVCDIARQEDVVLALTVACVEFWRYVTTTRDY